jgi:hypothetical protein
MYYRTRVQRRIFGLKGKEVMGGCTKLCNEQLHNLYPLADVIRIVKTGRIRWAWHVACMRVKM